MQFRCRTAYTEYRITQELKEPGIVQVYDLQKYQNSLVIFVEDFGGGN
ncbi:hypothetical protein QUB70_12535 [Microcoleus sp. A003_D6]